MKYRVICINRDIGYVLADDEQEGRLVALSMFGIEGERETVHALNGNPVPRVIYEDDDFEVIPV